MCDLVKLRIFFLSHLISLSPQSSSSSTTTSTVPTSVPATTTTAVSSVIPSIHLTLWRIRLRMMLHLLLSRWRRTLWIPSRRFSSFPCFLDNTRMSDKLQHDTSPYSASRGKRMCKKRKKVTERTCSASTPCLILFMIDVTTVLKFPSLLSSLNLNIFQVSLCWSQTTSTTRSSYCSPLAFHLQPPHPTYQFHSYTLGLKMKERESGRTSPKFHHRLPWYPKNGSLRDHDSSIT